MTDAAVKAELLRSFHVPGSPLILTNVWDAESARVVAEAPGTRAIATASHPISDRHGVPDGEGLDLEQALAAAAAIAEAVAMPVSVDFERGYAKDPAPDAGSGERTRAGAAVMAAGALSRARSRPLALIARRNAGSACKRRSAAMTSGNERTSR